MSAYTKNRAISGQSFTEYVLLLILVLLIGFTAFSVGGPQIEKMVNRFAALVGSPETPPETSTQTPAPTPISVILIPIAVPLMVALFTSVYDGTIKGNRHAIALKPGQLPAKLCLSLVSFDVWGIMASMLGKGDSATIPSVFLFMIFLLLFHIAAHSACLKWLADSRYRLVQLFLVFVSILGPLSLLLPKSVFIYPC